MTSYEYNSITALQEISKTLKLILKELEKISPVAEELKKESKKRQKIDEAVLNNSLKNTLFAEIRKEGKNK